MRADTSVGEIAGGLQAPYVLKVGDVWHMFYGDWEHICHATSTDGKTFTRVLTNGRSPIFGETPPPNTPNGVDGPFAVNTRDPMVLYDNGVYYLYYSAEATYDPATHAFEDGDYVRTSTDLMTWGPSKEVAFGIDDDSNLVSVMPLAAPEIVDDHGQLYVARVRADFQAIEMAHLTLGSAR